MFSKIAIALEAIMYVAWIGLHVTAGYVVAPVLFEHLPKMQAGNLAGEIFHVVSLVGALAALILIGIGRLSREKFFSSVRFVLLLLSFVCVLANEFLLTPVIAALKANSTDALLLRIVNNTDFGFWHGVSQGLYLLIIVLVLIHFFMWTRELKRAY